MEGTLILFTRSPVPGKTKTRLIPSLGADGAVNLHRALVERTLVAAKETARKLNLALEIHHTGTSSTMRQWLGPDLVFKPQVSGGLGERMLAALGQAAAPAVLVGTDCPDLDSKILTQAFIILQNHDMVLGPAKDGGYYLVGGNVVCSDLFAQISWSSDLVLSQSRNRLKAAGLSWAETDLLVDIDRPEDLALLPPHFFST